MVLGCEHDLHFVVRACDLGLHDVVVCGDLRLQSMVLGGEVGLCPCRCGLLYRAVARGGRNCRDCARGGTRHTRRYSRGRKQRRCWNCYADTRANGDEARRRRNTSWHRDRCRGFAHSHEHQPRPRNIDGRGHGECIGNVHNCPGGQHGDAHQYRDQRGDARPDSDHHGDSDSRSAHAEDNIDADINPVPSSAQGDAHPLTTRAVWRHGPEVGMELASGPATTAAPGSETRQLRSRACAPQPKHATTRPPS